MTLCVKISPLYRIKGVPVLARDACCKNYESTLLLSRLPLCTAGTTAQAYCVSKHHLKQQVGEREVRVLDQLHENTEKGRQKRDPVGGGRVTPGQLKD